MTELYLVRHAESPYSADDIGRGLSLKGKRSRKALAFLSDKPIQAIYTSPMKRCQATIEPVAKKLKLTPVVIEDLQERVASPAKIDPFLPALKYLWDFPTKHFPNGESNVVAQTRGISVIKQLVQRYPHEEVIVSTHGNLLALIINYYDASASYDFWRGLAFPSVVQLSVNETGVTYKILI